MQIAHLKIVDFLGIRLVDVGLAALTLFAGPNWSGKSSIQQAVRMALTGEVARVRLKGDYPMLIRDGAKMASVSLKTDLGDTEARIAPGGSDLLNPVDTSPALIYLLDPPRFATASEIDRRVLLFTALGLTLSRDDILQRMIAGEADPELAESLLPLLRAGFDAAEAEAKRQASLARATWKALTGEEYGKKKADTWKPNAKEETERLNAICRDRKKRTLLVGEGEIEADDYEAKVNAIRGALACARARFVCKECGAIAEPDEEAAAALQTALVEEEKALTMLRRMVDNRRRDLAACEEAAATLAKLKEELAHKKEKADEAHVKVGKWSRIAELLSPDGIQNDVLAASLKPLNDRLRASAAITGWPQVALAADMRVLINSRLYGLCSEAERWCADAMIVEAIAYLTHIKFLMLDRMDVLSLPRRLELLTWCDALVQQGHQVLLFATLKEGAAIEGVRVHWLEAGAVAQSYS